MNRMSVRIPAVFLLAVFCPLLSSCAPNLGATIEAPDLPAAAADGTAKPEIRARLGSYVTIQEVTDARNGITTDPDENYTEPYGGVNTIVEKGIKKAFQDIGVAVSDSAPISLRAEVRKWRAQVKSKGNSAISSEATIYVEAVDPSGKKVYSGTYNGARSSQFPVVTRVDVKDSLAIAMTNAINQLTSDQQLLELLGSF
jgi:hypothetical protein